MYPLSLPSPYRRYVLWEALHQEQQSSSFHSRLSLEGIHRHDRRIPCVALLDPTTETTPWEHLYTSGSDQALITTTGLDYHCFDYLEEQFAPLFNTHTPWSEDGSIRPLDPNRRPGGHPRKITSDACLALVLTWTRTKGSLWILQTFFGFTGTHIDLWFKFGRQLLLIVLKSMADVRVRMPTDDDIHALSHFIARQYPSLADTFCFCDGVKLCLQSAHQDLKIGRAFSRNAETDARSRMSSSA